MTFIPKAQDLSKAYKIDIVISIVSQYLVSLAVPENFFGDSSAEPVKSAIDLLRSVACKSRLSSMSLASNRDLIGDNSPIAKKWTEATRNVLMVADSDGLKAAESALVEYILGQLRDTLGPATPWNGATEKDIRSVFTLAYTFFQTLHRQHDAYQVRMLRICCEDQRSLFQGETMDQTTASDHGLDGNFIEVSVFPGLYKMRDGPVEHVRASINAPALLDVGSNRLIDHCPSKGEGATEDDICRAARGPCIYVFVCSYWPRRVTFLL